MRHLAFFVTLMFASMTGVSYADHISNAQNFADRGENEWFICHVEENHRNDRFVFNTLDAEYCTDVQEGHILFLPGRGAADHTARSKRPCAQRNPLCNAPG